MSDLLGDEDFELWRRAEAGIEMLKAAPNDFLQKWPVSKRVISSRANGDDPTFIDKVELAVA